jgi:hypothetical protein
MFPPGYVETVRSEKPGDLLFYPISFPGQTKSELKGFCVQFDKQLVELRV